jgi:hypothetical protein
VMPEKPRLGRRAPTLDGIEAPQSIGSLEFTEAQESEARKYRNWSAFTLIVGVAAPVALVAGLAAWLSIAGEAGSPQPENWPQLSRTLGAIERSLLPLLAISIAAPFAWRASTQGKRWGIYPVPILLMVTLAVHILL